MNLSKLLLVLSCFFFINVFSQLEKKQDLEEVIINSTRIEIPFSKSSKKITIVTSDAIKKSTATNITDLLQSIEGIDIIKRGTNGMQADIKIRGGSFQQTLILIDGFKTEDPQTGHHTMNMMIPLENIERIEIIKGSSARVFGQNAFTGAINIVTKKNTKDGIGLSSSLGSFNYQKGGITASKQFHKFNIFTHYSQQKSDGYRENTDFINNNIFIKSSIKTVKEPIHVIATFANRKFGAQYFYTPPSYNFKEYEETETSLFGVSTKITFSKLALKPKLYWKRNQDLFLLKRDNPSFFRNHNISNKVGVELNTSYKSKIGITGFGIDFAKVSLASSNLGNQNRSMVNAFIEHRYVTKNEKMDFTPGIAFSYFSDFDFNVFPGLDVGFKMNDNIRLFWNIGSSYRVPTYTEMYYNSPSTQGNIDLKPEKAFTQELGLKYHTTNLNASISTFYRVSNDLIDYVKQTNVSPFYKAENLRTISTKGFEFSLTKPFEFNKLKQQLKVGYTFLEDDYKVVNVFKSRYFLNNTIKHHFTTSLETQFFTYFKQTISYRYVDRPINKYAVLDAKISSDLGKIKLYALFNNILDVTYYEKEFVLMPKSNFEIGLKYWF